MTTFPQEPKYLTVCDFPKHRGRLWTDVIETDREYVHWILYESELELQDDLVEKLEWLLEGEEDY